MYLFGKYMLPHDYEHADKIGVGRLIMAHYSNHIYFYMIPGLWGAPLKILSGFNSTNINYAESSNGFGSGGGSHVDLPEHAHKRTAWNYRI